MAGLGRPAPPAATMAAAPPQGPQPPQGMPPQGMQAMPPDDAALGEPTTLEEQEAYDRHVALGMLNLYDDETLPFAIEAIRAQPEQEQAVGYIAGSLGVKVYLKERAEGRELPPSMVIPAVHELVQITAEAAENAGLGPFTPQKLEGAFYAAMDHVQKAAQEAGLYGEKEAREDVTTLEEMKRSGAIDRILAMVAEERAAEGGGMDTGMDMGPGAAPPAPPQRQGLMPTGAM